MRPCRTPLLRSGAGGAVALLDDCAHGDRRRRAGHHRELVDARPCRHSPDVHASVGWRLAIPLGACAAGLLAAVIWWNGLSPVRSPVTMTNGTTSRVEAPSVFSDPAASLIDDPSLSLMADLAGGLDWEDAAAAGLETRDAFARFRPRHRCERQCRNAVDGNRC